MKKTKMLNLLLILTSLMVYLEWGGDNKMFLWEGEIELISKIFKNPLAAIHPFTILPLVGQILLIFTLFQKRPNKVLTYLGLGGIGILVLFIFVIGIMSFKFKITLSTLPFLITGIFVIIHRIKISKKK